MYGMGIFPRLIIIIIFCKKRKLYMYTLDTIMALKHKYRAGSSMFGFFS